MLLFCCCDDQRKLEEEKVSFGLWFQRTRVHHGRAEGVGSWFITKEVGGCLCSKACDISLTARSHLLMVPRNGDQVFTYMILWGAILDSYHHGIHINDGSSNGVKSSPQIWFPVFPVSKSETFKPP